ncbi:hypothetical protein BS78_K033500 [Paspalum vaginatum]|uniref:Uncharacterized protein n=1 Tax=Paspalum vaginatum TaxID=158149 RepID=A0A9W7XA42_9POAL|nr:hypothetical protein BS78_K033500 [Paspalum vaginatum]
MQATFVKYCGIPTEEGVEEQQKRCSKYSRAAIGFAISTLITCMVSESFSTVDTAVTADLLSWRMKSVWGRFFLVYISSFHLLTMTIFVFISFDKAYGYYAALFVPLIIGAAFHRRKLWAGPGPGGGERRRQSTADDDAITKRRLDFMFDLSALILSLDSFISIAGHFPSGPNKYFYIAGAGAVGFLFFSTILLSLYLMRVSTVRTAVLTLHAMHLDVLLIVLVSTLTAAAVTFLCFPDQATE